MWCNLQHVREASASFPALRTKRLQGVHVLLIIAGIVHWRLQYEGLLLQLRMVQNSAKSLETDLTFANIRMPVETGSQGALRVIRMNDADVLQPKYRFDLLHGML